MPTVQDIRIDFEITQPRLLLNAVDGVNPTDYAYIVFSQWYKGDKGDPGRDGSDGHDGVDGTDGFSPTVETTTISGGTQVTITDAVGAHTFNVTNGTDGQDGTNGQDGFSPVVTVTTTADGHEVTITDAVGDHTFDVTDGHDGVGIPQTLSLDGNELSLSDGGGTVTLPDGLPSQTGNEGKFLTTNGTEASWTDVDALPDQTGQSGKFLTTNGSEASWDEVPEQVNADWEASTGPSEILHKPTLGTASEFDVAVSGNASTTQVVKGDDTRLSDSRNAADVYPWAKAATKPSYTASEVGALPDTTSIPTKTSDLTNDSGFITSANIPTNVSDLNNDAGYISNETDPTVPSWAKASTKPSYTASEVGAIASSEKGANNGVAELDATGKVPSSQLPSYVDDVLEYASQSAFPATGEGGKIYIALDTNKTYRWSGSAYAEISESLALGETSSTAYAGNKGKANADAIAAIKDGTIIDSFGDVETALADKINKSSTSGLVKNDGTIDTNTYLTQHQDISGKANKSEMSVVNGTGTDADKTTITLKNGTSATVLKSHQDISGKQDTLVSGTNIKTINNESVLGSGNINIVTELPSNLAYTSNDNGEGIIPSDGIRAESVTSAATMSINPDVVTVINGAVGTAAITLQVPNDNLAHVWDILMTTDSSVAITFAMSNSATILYPDGFSVGASKAVEISVIGVGTKYYLRYGEFA